MRRPAILVLLLLPFLTSVSVAAPTATLEILKVDDAGNPLIGACFQLYLDAGGGSRGEYRNAKCDQDDGKEDGTIAIRNLEPGNYVLEENRPPAGYVRGPDTPVTVNDAPVTTITVPNQREAGTPPVAPTAPVSTPLPSPNASPVAIASPQATPEIVERRVDIGGRSLFMTCAGAGSPTVILEAGGPGRPSTAWAEVLPEVARTTRVCSYDRAGLGQSDPAPEGERTAQDSVNDLRDLIEQAPIDCPCVLVGESWGGIIVRLYASQYASDVAGLVLVDSPPPGFIDRFLELVPEGDPEREILLGTEERERMNQNASLRQVDVVPPPSGTVPAIVITHGLLLGFSPDLPVEELETAWREGQTEHARTLNGRLVVAGKSGNDVVGDQPDIVVDAIAQVVSIVRDPTTAQGALLVETVDQSGKPLPGACYQVYEDAGNGARGSFRGGACDLADGADDGVTTVAPLPAGDYLAEQWQGPPGYKPVADTPVTVQGLGTDLTVTNEPALAVSAGLEALGGASSEAFAVNANGQVVGAADLESGERHAVLWTDGTPVDLGTIGGTLSVARDINDAGQVVGYGQNQEGVERAILWPSGAPGDITDLDALGGQSSHAYAINEAGMIVGDAETSEGAMHAALFADGAVTDLETLGGASSLATGINESGQIVGASDTDMGEYHAFLIAGEEMTDLGTIGGIYSAAYAINDAGLVVGESRTLEGEMHAVIWQDGQPRDIHPDGATDSTAYGVNSAGQVIGLYRTEDGETHLFLWADGTLTDQGPVGGPLSMVHDLNDAGVAVGADAADDEALRAVTWQLGAVAARQTPQPITAATNAAPPS
jgi:probable HAF family extracellular repeat protein